MPVCFFNHAATPITIIRPKTTMCNFQSLCIICISREVLEMQVQLGIWLPISHTEDATRSVRDPSSPRLPPKPTFPLQCPAHFTISPCSRLGIVFANGVNHG